MVNYKTIMSFGKHKGKTVKEVMETDPSYLLWADDNVEGFELSDYLRDKAEEMDEKFTIENEFFKDLHHYEDPGWELFNSDWGDRD